MEDALRVAFSIWSLTPSSVLILVVMEDALRVGNTTFLRRDIEES